MAYWYLSSWLTVVLAITIWSLVFHFISPRVYLIFVKAVVVILRHATLLRLSNIPSELALTHAELEYQEANIDSKICEHLMVSSQAQPLGPSADADFFMEYSQTRSRVPSADADFIMATDIGWSLLASLTIISYQAFSFISVWITCACKWCCLNSFCYNLNTVFSLLHSSFYGHLVVVVSLFPLSICL